MRWTAGALLTAVALGCSAPPRSLEGPGKLHVQLKADADDKAVFGMVRSMFLKVCDPGHFPGMWPGIAAWDAPRISADRDRITFAITGYFDDLRRLKPAPLGFGWSMTLSFEPATPDDLRSCVARRSQALATWKKDVERLEQVLQRLDADRAREEEKTEAAREDLEEKEEAAMAAFRRHDYAAALAICRKLSRIAPRNPVYVFNIACAYSLTGDADRAIATLEEALKAGYDNLLWMDQDPAMENARKDPRYAAIRAKARDAYFKALPFEKSLPPEYDPAKKYPLLLAVDDALEENLSLHSLLRETTSAKECIVVTLNPSTVGRSHPFLSPERRLENAFVSILENAGTVGSIDPRRVFLVGYGSRGDWWYAVATKHPRQVAGLLLIDLGFLVNLGDLELPAKAGWSLCSLEGSMSNWIEKGENQMAEAEAAGIRSRFAVYKQKKFGQFPRTETATVSLMLEWLRSSK